MAKKALIQKWAKKPKFSTRSYNRCKICGRPHGYIRKFQMCRICFRNQSYAGAIPGITTNLVGSIFRIGRNGSSLRQCPAFVIALALNVDHTALPNINATVLKFNNHCFNIRCQTRTQESAKIFKIAFEVSELLTIPVNIVILYNHDTKFSFHSSSRELYHVNGELSSFVTINSFFFIQEGKSLTKILLSLLAIFFLLCIMIAKS